MRIDTEAEAEAVGESPSDLTGRARLREAAIECFAAEGFDVSVRTIAAKAGVTAGLIRHHFGSKDALRAECDAWVLREYNDMKTVGILKPSVSLIDQMANLDSMGPMLGYMLRSVREGGEFGRAFLQHMIDDTLVFVREGIRIGAIRPSRDVEALTRLMITQSIGGIIAQLTLTPEVDIADFPALVKRVVESNTLPSLELFTHGVLVDDSYLTQYLEYLDSNGGHHVND